MDLWILNQDKYHLGKYTNIYIRQCEDCCTIGSDSGILGTYTSNEKVKDKDKVKLVFDEIIVMLQFNEKTNLVYCMPQDSDEYFSTRLIAK